MRGEHKDNLQYQDPLMGGLVWRWFPLLVEVVYNMHKDTRRWTEEDLGWSWFQLDNLKCMGLRLRLGWRR